LNIICETVMNVEDARITTFESFCNNSWYHPTKVFPLYWSETLEKYVSVPELNQRLRMKRQVQLRAFLRTKDMN
jgi:hypothetical protein